ncbi:hypothetical protein F4805DRAFT_417419 [Annulohypoxylon moriforme]|nr:hypothetical protein F4805DRAFT_417419 [Annulohypoxylon moriforme]
MELGQGPFDLEQYPNYVLIKIDFEKNFGKYQGASILIVPDRHGSVTKGNIDYSQHACGVMIFVPLEYQFPSPNSARTFEFSLPPGAKLRPLRDMLTSITKVGLQYFDFVQVKRTGKLRGSRDFIYQTLVHLASAGFIDDKIIMMWPIVPGWETNVFETISDVIGMHFNNKGGRRHPIRKGRFRFYQRSQPILSPYELDSL